ncbi:hypothetical protein [Dactylosporangium sp. CA-233914]|uniref:hypothetical protein n=1 Tax=Dactylosporangium sp. CA-233914 TaxID=3239934 RepID=UPI003D900FA1
MPKSRGRPAGRGRAKRPQREVRELRLSDRLLRDAASIGHEERVLEVDRWASGWLGQAWLAAGLGERAPEHQLCLEVVGRVSGRPSAHGLAAVAALRRVAPPDEWSLLDGTIETLSAHHPVPPWFDEPAVEPLRAWRAVDVWDSEHVLFVEYAGPVPHTLMAQIPLAGGVLVECLALLDPRAAASWEELREPGEAPMPLVESPVGEVLAELADALRTTDMTLPRQDDEDFVDLRALAWARCRSHLPGWPEHTPSGDAERDRLLDDFMARPADGPVDDSAVRSLAELFLDYGEGYLVSGPLCWSPGSVGLFLADWLPRKAVLDAEQRAALPEALRRWVRFALDRRGVPPKWIDPVVQAIDAFVPAFTEAFDDTAAWGPAKQIAVELAAGGVDLSDRDAVDDAVRAHNAGRLARYLTEQ